MHDPMTVAFTIKYPWPRFWANRDPWGEFYRDTFTTIWHVDPEKGGSDDSCGWFKRARHGDQELLEKIRHDFEFEWEASYGGWFNEDGSPRLSVSGIALNMFRVAAYQFFGQDWAKATAFMKRNLYEILMFAENNTDSMHNGVVQKYGPEKKAKRIGQHAHMVYGWILREEQPWYRHARWHVWHWKLQIHPLQEFKRWAFSKCYKCNKGFSWGYAPISEQWNSDGPRWFKSEEMIRHDSCENPGRGSQACQAKPDPAPEVGKVP